MEGRVERKASQRNQRQVAAGRGLHGIGCKRHVPTAASLTSLQRRQHRHRDECGNGDGDTAPAGFRLDTEHERPDGRRRNRTGEHKQKAAGYTACLPLRNRYARDPLQQNNGRRQKLHQAVGAKSIAGLCAVTAA